MQLASQLELQKSLLSWIDGNLKNVPIPVNPQSELSIGCFDLALEHHAAIVLLADSRLFGSMFALMRVIYEAQMRGLWLRYCATTTQYEQYRKGRLDKEFGTLVKEIETAIGAPGSRLSRLKNNSWALMNSLTHTGSEQALARHSDGAIGGNYHEESVSAALVLAGSFALMAPIELATYADQKELVNAILQKADRKSTRLNSSHSTLSRMPSSA